MPQTVETEAVENENQRGLESHQTPDECCFVFMLAIELGCEKPFQASSELDLVLLSSPSRIGWW